MTRPKISVLITDLDNTLFDWVEICVLPSPRWWIDWPRTVAFRAIRCWGKSKWFINGITRRSMLS